jgi:hypothetical protein
LQGRTSNVRAREQLKVLEGESEGEGDHSAAWSPSKHVNDEQRDGKNEVMFPSDSQRGGEGQESERDNPVGAKGDQDTPVAHDSNRDDALVAVRGVPRPCHVRLDARSHEDTKVENVEMQVERDQPADGLQEGMVGNSDRATGHEPGEGTQTWRERVGDD